MTKNVTAPNEEASVTPMRGNAQAKPFKLKQRIGSTTFFVNVRFSNTSAETLEDKIHRLIEREVEKSA